MSVAKGSYSEGGGFTTGRGVSGGDLFTKPPCLSTATRATYGRLGGLGERGISFSKSNILYMMFFGRRIFFFQDFSSPPPPPSGPKNELSIALPSAYYTGGHFLNPPSGGFGSVPDQKPTQQRSRVSLLGCILCARFAIREYRTATSTASQCFGAKEGSASSL